VSRIDSGIRNEDGVFDVAPPGLLARNSLFPALTRWANEFRRLRRLGAEYSGLARNTLRGDRSVPRSGTPQERFGYLRTRFGRWQRGDAGELLEEVQAATRRENFPRRSARSLPPLAAEAAAFISPARQRWERIVADGKPWRGDIKSNRLSRATGVCREAAYLRNGLAYLRT
jgi:hypothetical protein